MSIEDVRHKGSFVLTLKGRITVHFLDGNTLEGEIATQDEFNIFLTINNQPYMIPRSQIRYITGAPDQQVERDTSQKDFLESEVEQVDDFETKPPDSAELVIPPGVDISAPEVAELDLDDGDTFVIQSDVDDLISDIPTPDVSEAVVDDEEDDGMTFVLDEATDWADDITEEVPDFRPDLEDVTVVIEESEEDTIAQLTCTTGPHAGEVVKLGSEVATIGRSSDNQLSLFNDKEVSRRHAIIMYEMGKFMVQDQNSLNGTFVNDENIEGHHYLDDGDIILIGVSYLEFREK